MDVDGKGFSVGGSFSVSPAVAINVLYGTMSFDRVLGLDIDSTEFDFGVTVHTPAGPGTDIVGSFTIINAEVEVSDGFNTASDDDIGNGMSFSIRHMLSDNAELNVGVTRWDIFDDTSTVMSIGTRFYSNEKVSFGAAYSTVDDVDTISFSLRIEQ